MITDKYAPGTVIPDTVYQVNRVIGEGGMGVVYEVTDITIGKQYALKTLVGAHADSPDLIELMRKESRTLVRVAHANIVDVITAGITGDKRFYYVMELLSGNSLRKLLTKKGKLDMLDAVHIAIDVGEGLQQAHTEGVVHRDIKPDNIFIVFRKDTTTQAKLVDFGVAALLENLRGEAGQVFGTPRYASPEQQRGEKATPLMDIWSLGYVLFEMIVGQGPFGRRSVADALAVVQGPEPAAYLLDFEPNAPPKLAKLIAWMLEKDPSRRLGRVDIANSELTGLQRVIEIMSSASGGVDDNRTLETVAGAINRTGDRTAEDPPRDVTDEDPANCRVPTLVGMGSASGAARESGSGRSGPPVSATPTLQVKGDKAGCHAPAFAAVPHAPPAAAPSRGYRESPRPAPEPTPSWAASGYSAQAASQDASPTPEVMRRLLMAQDASQAESRWPKVLPAAGRPAAGPPAAASRASHVLAEARPVRVELSDVGTSQTIAPRPAHQRQEAPALAPALRYIVMVTAIAAVLTALVTVIVYLVVGARPLQSAPPQVVPTAQTTVGSPAAAAPAPAVPIAAATEAAPASPSSVPLPAAPPVSDTPTRAATAPLAAPRAYAPSPSPYSSGARKPQGSPSRPKDEFDKLLER